MINAHVNEGGEVVEDVYPMVKRWQGYNTMAIFSSETHAIVISVDENHPDDFVGEKVGDPTSKHWEKIKNFSITISG